MELSTWMVRGLAPVWVAGLAVTGFMGASELKDLGFLKSSLLVVSVALLGIWSVLVLESGFWSCAFRLWDLYRWIFLGRTPECPKCHGTGRRFPLQGRSMAFEILALVAMLVGAAWFVAALTGVKV